MKNNSVSIPAHKFVLAARSSQLRDMLTSSTIQFPDASPETISSFVEFLYTQEIEIPNTLVAEFKKIAKSLNVSIDQEIPSSDMNSTISAVAYLIFRAYFTQRRNSCSSFLF